MVATVVPVATVVATVATAVATVATVAPVATAVATVDTVATPAEATVVDMVDVALAAMVARLRPMEAQANNTDIRVDTVDTAADHTDGEEPKMTSQALNARESYQFDGLMRESPVCLVL